MALWICFLNDGNSFFQVRCGASELVENTKGLGFIDFLMWNHVGIESVRKVQSLCRLDSRPMADSSVRHGVLRFLYLPASYVALQLLLLFGKVEKKRSELRKSRNVCEQHLTRSLCREMDNYRRVSPGYQRIWKPPPRRLPSRRKASISIPPQLKSMNS